MPNYCSTCSPELTCCDFCKHYDFNADDQGSYTGNGWCKLHLKNQDPGDVCDDYYCFNIKENE